MELIDFYRELKVEDEIIHGFFQVRKNEYNKGYPTTSVESLAYYVTNMTKNVVAYSMSYLEDEEEVCYKCIYHRMDMARKAITRYLVVETEDIGDYKYLLTDTREKLNDWCMYINKTFDMKSNEEHIHIKNDAYDLIQLEIDYEDDED